MAQPKPKQRSLLPGQKLGFNRAAAKAQAEVVIPAAMLVAGLCGVGAAVTGLAPVWIAMSVSFFLTSALVYALTHGA